MFQTETVMNENFLPDSIVIEHDEKNAEIEIRGKFIFVGEEKFNIRGVTYGAFQSDENGCEYFDAQKIDMDFAMMTEHGINTVRIPHTAPPRMLLDIAHKHHLKVMIGLSAEQYAGYLVDTKNAPDIQEIIRKKVRECADHPALLLISLGNEISASLVRWIGHKKIENYLKAIYETVKKEAPNAIITYVNYPTTEYLQLSFLDLLCFNVYLESPYKLENYLARLQNMAGNRPLILGEVGLDSLRNGLEKQAEVLKWQIATGFKMGCAGLFVFSWTDEWFRGDEEVLDWAFGLTDKHRNSKPALNVVKEAFRKIPFDMDGNWPTISVVLCSYNGSKTIRECLNGLLKLNYPHYEVIVINDGSTDHTEAIASSYPFRLINSVNKGLSFARNLGANAASGEIIAYIDDDAVPDSDWLLHLASSYKTTNFAAIGGPNLVPLNACFMEQCVDHAPGCPTHVLLTDREAEHIPGCNFSIRKKILQQVGGFDPLFRVAGDDVDLCWRIEEAGCKIGYNAAAMVWHHRRQTLKGYWKQQLVYGKAEAMLERKWPKKYNNLGHKTWNGRIYSNGNLTTSSFNSGRIYYGVWGNAPFQSIYRSKMHPYFLLFLVPEWYLLSASLLILALFNISWAPLIFLWPLALIISILPQAHAIYYVANISRHSNRKKEGWICNVFWRLTTGFLHIIQPFARLWGRLKLNLTLWRRFGEVCYAFPMSQQMSVWCETWISPDCRLRIIESDLRQHNRWVELGGEFSRWDLKIRGGGFGSITLLMAAEDHKQGKQLLRFRFVPKLSFLAIIPLWILIFIFAVALMDNYWIPQVVFGLLLLILLVRISGDFGSCYSILKAAAIKQSEVK
ncbi:MAG: glycosyl transferase, family 2 [Sphingobacteriales bacterium]|nr:glycosyl transferase, family 2 [Sphingobacteriales bacterium]